MLAGRRCSHNVIGCLYNECTCLFFLYVYHIVFVFLYSIFDVCFGDWRHGLKRKSLHSESLIQCLFWVQTISGNCKCILWSCWSSLVFLILSLLYSYLYFYRICIFVWCREESKIVQAECNKRMPHLTPGSTFFNQPSTSTLCSVFLDAISHPYIHFVQPTQHKRTVFCVLYF